MIVNKTEIINFIKKNWKKKDLKTIQKETAIDLYSILQIAFDSGLQSTDTEDIGRRWTIEEDSFLKDYSNKLSINDACNLLHRSRYATYQRIKMLDLTEMISKRNTKG